jgi:hypothetical protein
MAAAVEADLNASAGHEADGRSSRVEIHMQDLADVASEQRLEKLETQTQLLAEAVVAIAQTDPAIASAVQAVKNTLDHQEPTDTPSPTPTTMSETRAELVRLGDSLELPCGCRAVAWAHGLDVVHLSRLQLPTGKVCSAVPQHIPLGHNFCDKDEAVRTVDEPLRVDE